MTNASGRPVQLTGRPLGLRRVWPAGGARRRHQSAAALAGPARSALEGARRTDALLLSAVRHGGATVCVLVLTAIVLAGAETAFPAVLGRGVDAAVHGHGTGWLFLVAVLVAGIAAVDALDELAAAAVTARSTAWLRRALTRHVLSLGTGALDHHPPGDLVARVLSSSGQVGRVGVSSIRALANLLPAIGGPVGLALIDPWLCVTFLSGVPVLWLLGRTLHREVQDVAAGYLGAQGEIAGRLVEALGGVRTVAAAGKLDAEAARVLAPLAELHRHGVGLWRTQMRIVAQNGLLVSLLEAAVLAVAGVQLAAGRITLGQMLAAAQYVLLGATMTSVFSFVNALARARAAAARIAEVMSVEGRRHGTARLPAGGGRIELRGVTVCRDGRPVLSGVDLDLPARALVALVGRSGAGKSLLAAVAGRLIDPDEGEVRLDGVPLRELSAEDLRRAVAYAFDRPALLGDTVAATIALGAWQPPLYQVVEAAVAARADGFIRRLPRRYRTPLGDAPLSGGEVQRLGLARAFAHAGRVMILDDVATSLDTVTEHHISQLLLAGPLAQRTRLIVARRVSTAAAADFVVWLEGGGVRAVGPHAELWRDPGYREVLSCS